MIGGSPASSAYAIPCGTSSADSTRPATMSFGSHARSVRGDQCETGQVRPPSGRGDGHFIVGASHQCEA